MSLHPWTLQAGCTVLQMGEKLDTLCGFLWRLSEKAQSFISSRWRGGVAFRKIVLALGRAGAALSDDMGELQVLPICRNRMPLDTLELH